jgi:hypothetical protein
MLVRFDSEVGSVTMFGDIAVKLLKMMGHSGTVPSALLAPDIPPALARLRAGVGSTPDDQSPTAAAQDEKQPNVSLKQRAFPLIELLERAAQRGVDITWAAA